METEHYSLIVIGSGISGLYAALRVNERLGLKNILILTKSELKESNSTHAQGGIASVLPENKDDSVELHVKDTLKAGAGLSSPSVSTFISERGAKIIDDLIKKGVLFDRDAEQKIALTLEAAHSVRRILHAGGDATGRFIGQALAKKVISNPDIEVRPYTQAVELLVDEDNTCHGVIGFDEKSKKHIAFIADATVIATGGIGQIYAQTTNPDVATADGMAIAYNAGARLQDMEFIQFHPTTFRIDGEKNNFLISEAVRGEGAKLKNFKGEEFAKKYNEKGELAPRDIVTRAIYFEIKETGSDKIFLDATKIDKAHLLKRFPSISQKCLEHGIDITKDLIPVSPAAHYFMGGIKVETSGKTDIKNLFASGEVSCTSLHGANRLASNSLLECVVLSDELARNVKPLKSDFKVENSNKISDAIKKYDLKQDKIANQAELRKSLKETMWLNAGIIRNQEKLSKALNDIKEIKKQIDGEVFSSIEEYELKNMLTIAEIIVKSALARKESRGSHYRNDYLETSTTAKHSFTSKDRKDKNDEIYFE
ncbi:MAG: L-aspartate oxidase [bacterium]|nr:L-aspartate oxidase [bacterium]